MVRSEFQYSIGAMGGSTDSTGARERRAADVRVCVVPSMRRASSRSAKGGG